MKSKLFLPATIAFVLYWPLIWVMSLIAHSMAWNSGPQGIGESILYYFARGLMLLPGGFIVNSLFIALIVFLFTLAWHGLRGNLNRKL